MDRIASASVYDEPSGRAWASSASSAAGLIRSSGVYGRMDAPPRSRTVRTTRRAISPRLAIRMRLSVRMVTYVLLASGGRLHETRDPAEQPGRQGLVLRRLAHVSWVGEAVSRWGGSPCSYNRIGLNNPRSHVMTPKHHCSIVKISQRQAVTLETTSINAQECRHHASRIPGKRRRSSRAARIISSSRGLGPHRPTASGPSGSDEDC